MSNLDHVYRLKSETSSRGLRRLSRKRKDIIVLGFTAFLAERNRPLSIETRKAYKGRVQWAMEHCEKKGVDFLAGDMRTVRLILGALPPHPSSQNGMISALSSFYTYLVDLKLRDDNPVDKVPRCPVFRHYPRPLSVEDCLAYEAAAKKLGLRHEMVAVLGLYQGFRVTEMATAQWNWWFSAGGQVFIDVTGKGGGTGRVGAHDRTVEALERLRESHQDGLWLFPSGRTRPSQRGHLSDRTMERYHHEICDKAGLKPHPVLHQLRHTFATYLRASGADVAMVQKGLRHRHISSTMIYMDVLPQELGDAINRVDYRRAAKQQNLPEDIAPGTLGVHENSSSADVHRDPETTPDQDEDRVEPGRVLKAVEPGLWQLLADREHETQGESEVGESRGRSSRSDAG